jgi:hypothetical protein
VLIEPRAALITKELEEITLAEDKRRALANTQKPGRRDRLEP